MNNASLKARHRRKRRALASQPPPPVALTLLEASYGIDEDIRLRLTFDRAIDASGIVGTQITVGIQEYGYLYNATGLVIEIDPATIDIILVQIGGFEGEHDELNATAGSGIVADNDGGTWAGVSGLALPFP